MNLSQWEDLFSLIEASEGKALKLLVYNTQSDRCREVLITPNGGWGGEGRYGRIQSRCALLIMTCLML